MWGTKNKYGYQPKIQAPRQSLTSMWLPNMLEKKPTYIGMLTFGFLSFLWLTCKAPSLVGDLNLATKLVLQAYSFGGSSWVLNSGCTNHMTREKSMFPSYSPMQHSNENIVFGDNSKGDMIGLGKVAITLEHSITNVLYVDSLSYNLLSVSQLCEMGYNCLFSDRVWKSLEGRIPLLSLRVN